MLTVRDIKDAWVRVRLNAALDEEAKKAAAETYLTSDLPEVDWLLPVAVPSPPRGPRTTVCVFHVLVTYALCRPSSILHRLCPFAWSELDVYK